METASSHLSSKAVPLVITGMHRSGTSLAASLLQSSGVDVGKRLMGASEFNRKGHFENLDFVNFHRSVLESQGLHEAGWTLQDTFEITYPQVQQAQQIIEQNTIAPIWGWKDPRTTLFLDFWANLLPDAKFLFLYRAPWEVVDSLLRRSPIDKDIFLERPDYAVQMWLHYNQKVLQFCERFPERSLLVSVDSLTHQVATVITAVNTKFGLDLAHPDSNIYDQSLLHTEISKTSRPCLIQHYVPEAISVYEALTRKEVAMLQSEVDQSWLTALELSTGLDWAFQDWLEQHRLRHELKTLQQGQASYQQHREHLEQEVSRFANESASLKEQVDILATDLAAARHELAQAQANLAAREAALAQLQQHQHQALAELQHQREAENQQQQQMIQQLSESLTTAKAQIAAIETSKFWKIRQRWFGLKRKIGINR
ncbi:MAG TPA: sulfotransferase [Leptolyngbyaceae cyanobacterium M33_DOE_097]|uniref:Uncharacterized protein n=1 Tax=Oscillatoriales cyanobacterium SpSt-418 TaxID=2282169 RepID=A0A7C3PFX9_9CYAN|nr:sulfotransferase [Leptolyngbyaceae cyanobacterium M33_DOE_097]